MKIQFTDYELNSEDIIKMNPNRIDAPWNPEWTRVEVVAGNFWMDNDKLIQFIEENIQNGAWDYYSYQNSAPSYSQTIVVGFEHPDDAIMFKLRGGHKILEESE